MDVKRTERASRREKLRASFWPALVCACEVNGSVKRLRLCAQCTSVRRPAVLVPLSSLAPERGRESGFIWHIFRLNVHSNSLFRYKMKSEMLLGTSDDGTQ